MQDNILIEQRAAFRHEDCSIPNNLRMALIVIDDEFRLPVKIVNMSNCGFLFQAVNVHYSMVDLTICKGEYLPIEFPLIGITVCGLSVNETTIDEKSTYLRFFISNPHDQNLINEIIRMGNGE